MSGCTLFVKKARDFHRERYVRDAHRKVEAKLSDNTIEVVRVGTNFTCSRMTDTASKDVVHVLRNMWKMFLGFHRAATYESRNTDDGDISGHTSVFIFPRVCFVT